MSTAGGPKITSDNLVLCLDAHDAKSYPGQPVTNLSYSGSGDNQYLAQGYDWDNSGAGTRNRNVTDIRKPKAVNDNVFNERYIRICSCVVATVGSIHFGMGYTTSVSASTQYMVSLYYRQNKAGIGGPYIRGATSNANHGALKWVGRDGKQDISGSSNWPVNEWIRLKAYATTASNETGLYISNYIGSVVGDKIWSFGPQIETGSKFSPLVRQARSTTDAWKDRSGNDYHGDLLGGVNTGVSHYRKGQVIEPKSNAYLDLDGTDDYVDLTSDVQISPDNQGWTAEYWFRTDAASTLQHFNSAEGDEFNANWLAILSSKLAVWNRSPGYWRYGDTVIQSNRWYCAHFVCDSGGTNMRFYIDGVREGGDHVNNVWTASYSSLEVRYIGSYKYSGSMSRYFNGKISIAAFYNRALSNAEIKLNFNARRGRYGV